MMTFWPLGWHAAQFALNISSPPATSNAEAGATRIEKAVIPLANARVSLRPLNQHEKTLKKLELTQQMIIAQNWCVPCLDSIHPPC